MMVSMLRACHDEISLACYTSKEGRPLFFEAKCEAECFMMSLCQNYVPHKGMSNYLAGYVYHFQQWQY